MANVTQYENQVNATKVQIQLPSKCDRYNHVVHIQVVQVHQSYHGGPRGTLARKKAQPLFQGLSKIQEKPISTTNAILMYHEIFFCTKPGRLQPVTFFASYLFVPRYIISLHSITVPPQLSTYYLCFGSVHRYTFKLHDGLFCNYKKHSSTRALLGVT